MSTTTIEDQLAEIRRRIDRLQVLAQTGLVAESARIQRHLDALHQEEASALAAVHGGPDEVEQKLGQLRTRLAVAENSVAADASDDWTTFAAAVEDELRSWDTYLERLQATAVTKAGNVREPAEAAIADVRTPTDRGLRPPRTGARQRLWRLARAEEPRRRGSRRARTEGRRTFGEAQLKLRLRRRRTCNRSTRLW